LRYLRKSTMFGNHRCKKESVVHSLDAGCSTESTNSTAEKEKD